GLLQLADVLGQGRVVGDRYIETATGGLGGGHAGNLRAPRGAAQSAGRRPETKSPALGGALRHVSGGTGQSSPLDRSSSATTSAAAHSSASRSLRSRSAFSTAST